MISHCALGTLGSVKTLREHILGFRISPASSHSYTIHHDALKLVNDRLM